MHWLRLVLLKLSNSEGALVLRVPAHPSITGAWLQHGRHQMSEFVFPDSEHALGDMPWSGSRDTEAPAVGSGTAMCGIR